MQQPIRFQRSTTYTKLLLFIFVTVLLIASFMSGYFVAFRTFSSPNEDRYLLSAVPEEIREFRADLYEEVYSSLKESYVDPKQIDDKKLFYGAVAGMVNAIGDPYTIFLDPTAHTEFNNDIKGTFEGIGAEIGRKSDQIVIIAPLENSPADRAGIRAGDIIYSIDDKETLGMNLDEAVSLIRGSAGTVVRLALLRNDQSASAFTVEVTREKIVVPVVRTTITDAIAHIELFNFHSESTAQLTDALMAARNASVKGIILDLRNNPGGLLDKSIDVASAWVPAGEIVVREIFNDARLNIEHAATKQVQAPSVPTVVLVNEGSASASEIVAGALQDYGLATIVGVKTYGKGSVQDLRSLSDGSALKITIAQWLTPKGRLINKLGIEPDVVVENENGGADEEKNDTQLKKAFEIIRQKLQ